MTTSTAKRAHLYRPDIDGLRAIAVGVVVLYHAGFAGLPGGFVGVDVFFVISGYLITSIVLKELQSDRFSLAEFYLRRARRILPAPFAVTGACMLFGLLVMAPTELRALAKSVAFTQLFSSNILFVRQGGYFDSASELQPMLMTWSLAIEEQYYLLWPFLLGLLFRRRRILLWSAIFCLGSFLLSCWAVLHAPQQAFFLLPYRAWELGVGALLGIGMQQQAAILPRRQLRDTASVAGLALILYAALRYSADTRFPGWGALPPVAGAALLIWAGPEALVNRLLLARRGFVLLGLISYSLYLWHWPLLAFARIIYGMSLSANLIAAILLTSILLATLSYRYVETPFRQGKTSRPHSRPLPRYGMAIVALALAAGGVYASNGMEWRVLSADAGLAERMMREHSHQFARNCMGDDETQPKYLEPSCTTNAQATRSVVLWGDSHAGYYIGGIEEYFAARGYAVVFAAASGCSPILDFDNGFERNAACMARNRALLDWTLANPAVEGVVFAARWSGYAQARNADGTAWGKILRHSASSAPRNSADALNVMTGQLRDQIRQLDAAGKFSILAGEVPDSPFSVPACIEARSLWLRETASCEIDEHPARERIKSSNDMLISLAEETGACSFLPFPTLCSDGTCRIYDDQEQLMYIDDDHLSIRGSLFLSKAFDFGRCLSSADADGAAISPAQDRALLTR